MATRFRLTSDNTAPAVSPATQSYTHIQGTRRKLLLTDTSTLVTEAYTPDAVDDLTAGDALHVQFVSNPLEAGAVFTTGDTLKYCNQGLEASAANNLTVSPHISVVDEAGTTVRAVLRTKQVGASELPGVLNSRFRSTTLTGSYTLVAGDRIVVEYFVTGTPTAAGGVQGHNASLRWGSGGAGGDLLENDTQTGTTLDPWIEFVTNVTEQSGSTQPLTGSLFSKAPSFFAGVVSVSGVTVISGVLFAKASTFFTGTVSPVFPGGIPAAKVVAWYAARRTTAVDGDPISTIPELSDSGANDLFQNQASKQGRWLDNIVNSLPVFRFDGGDHYKAAWNQTIAEPYQVFIVLNLRTPFAFDNDEVYFAGFNNPQSSDKHLLAITESTTLPTINQPLTPPDWLIEQAGADQHVVGGTPLDDTWYVVRVDFEDAGDSVTVNGALIVGPWNAGHLSSVGITVGAREDGNRGATGDIAEVLFCQDLTTGEKQAVQLELMETYGIATPISQTPNATTSNVGWDTAPSAGQSIHTYIATDDADYITVTVP